MGLRRTLSVLVVFAIPVVLAGPARPALALDCAVFPEADMSPSAIVAGKETMWNDRPFFESYDFAITGTVASIATDEAAGSATYGRTEVAFDVLNGYGLETVQASVVVTESDPGWNGGYFFELGQTYFVPLKTVGPQGEPNYSFLCDPIAQMTLAEAEGLPRFASEVLTVAAPVGELTAGSTPIVPAESAAPTTVPAPPDSSATMATPTSVYESESPEPGDEAVVGDSGKSQGVVIGGAAAVLVLVLVGWAYSARWRLTRAKSHN